MENPLTKKERKELQKKLLLALEGQIDHLQPELQKILTDDLITALQNRLTALTRIQTRQNTLNPENILSIHKPFIHTQPKQN